MKRKAVILPTWALEREAWEAGRVPVAGVDEAGRGPLAGPVVAAAVVLPAELEIPGLQDSKQLATEEREWLYGLILESAGAVGVAAVEPACIDRMNILRASHEAMRRALTELVTLPAIALVDGLPVQGLPCPHRAVVRGDGCCVSIAAASVIAKVHRDRLMVALDAVYPEYGFARHKGYPTPEHQAALLRHGPCPAHRRSFRPVSDVCGLLFHRGGTEGTEREGGDSINRDRQDGQDEGTGKNDEVSRRKT